MSIACGHCGGRHESVREVRECSQQPTAAEQDTASIVRDHVVPGDPWEGATESEAGVWTPGPDYYLQQRREREANGEEYPSFHPSELKSPEEYQKEFWDNKLKDLEEGFYALSEDEIYQVVRSKAGRLYAKINAGPGRWDYAAGAITKLKPNMRMDLDAAKEYGKETGTCIVCGRTLTNPDSIEAGIGPICAERF
ncbi:hypothetical protein SEA_WOLLYPOG_39 [Arthrobacter phage Wollypog]|uniref:Uncharacterized protein n=1 Tax=Arthrobacter phage Wollypog TaxID=2790985 RepID=A0A7T3KC78_9CAUD|nr:hypothetical protein PP291_gp39 [Arthrobacter phage Wollypog]QPX62591.1 hypothetical protein SEA_WOLLYPOG_39 [Arthrobacter phage Wollypog]